MNLIIPIWLIDTLLKITYIGIIPVSIVIIFFANERKKGYPRGKKELVDDGIIKLLKNYHITVLLAELLYLYKWIFYYM